MGNVFINLYRYAWRRGDWISRLVVFLPASGVAGSTECIFIFSCPGERGSCYPETQPEEFFQRGFIFKRGDFKCRIPNHDGA